MVKSLSLFKSFKLILSLYKTSSYILIQTSKLIMSLISLQTLNSRINSILLPTVHRLTPAFSVLSTLLPPPSPSIPYIQARNVHSRRQLKRFAPGHGSPMDVRYRRSNNKLRNTLPTLDEADDLAAVRDNFREWIVNDGADVSMSKLSNGFVLPPPTISASPTFLVKRTEKEKGMGFYPIYSTYKNSGSRVFTTVKVHGNVLDFIASLHTLVVIPSEESGVTER